MLNSGITKSNTNEYGRFDELKNSFDKAKAYFKKMEGTTVPPFKVNMRVHNLLKNFIRISSELVGLIYRTSTNNCVYKIFG